MRSPLAPSVRAPPQFQHSAPKAIIRVCISLLRGALVEVMIVGKTASTRAGKTGGIRSKRGKRRASSKCRRA